MLVNLSFPDYLITVVVRTGNRELQNEPPNWNIRFESFGRVDPQIAERASWGSLDALFAEEVMTTWGLYGILIDIKAYWAEPSIIRQT